MSEFGPLWAGQGIRKPGPPRSALWLAVLLEFRDFSGLQCLLLFFHLKHKIWNLIQLSDSTLLVLICPEGSEQREVQDLLQRRPLI